MPLAQAHHSGASIEDIYLIIGICAGCVAVLGGAAAVFRFIWRRMRKLGHRLGNFLDDWNGTEGRPGVPRRAGVMERLEDHGNQLSDIQERVSGIEQTISPGQAHGGNSHGPQHAGLDGTEAERGGSR